MGDWLDWLGCGLGEGIGIEIGGCCGFGARIPEGEGVGRGGSGGGA